ncbi:aminotransferase class I/II-fold pyridoxal phosphate-dependent enzyme [Brevibacterium samyangense]|uniref:Pyridoxal phosphate-dependent aminotransferase n=1 Tax=Brevibacterium samyangense TaxID=366888 RepID=A0ABN2TA75_9MICO
MIPSAPLDPRSPGTAGTTPSAGGHPDVLRAPLWHAMADAAGLVAADGTVGETIFGQMTALAATHGAVNLGQGAPGTDTPGFLVEAAAEAMRSGMNQYPPAQGLPALREAVVTQRAKEHGHHVTPEQVLVTVGATEALTAAVLALLPRGGTALLFEPFYDGYAAAVAAAGAEIVTVPVLPTPEGFAPDWDVFDARIAAGVDLMIVNSPHNPTGMVLGREDLLRIHAGAVSTDAWIVTDEVYEYLVFDGREHLSLAALVDDPGRIVTVSSAGKTFNTTGWKVGWCIAAPEVREAIQAVKQFLTFVGSGPFQPAIARALTAHTDFGAQNRDSLAARRDVLLDALAEVPGARIHRPGAGYFALVDFAEVPGPAVEHGGPGRDGAGPDAFALNAHLTAEYGFTGIPVSGLCRTGSPAAAHYASTIRYSFCKAPEDVERAAAAIRRFGRSLAGDATD